MLGTHQAGTYSTLIRVADLTDGSWQQRSGTATVTALPQRPRREPRRVAEPGEVRRRTLAGSAGATITVTVKVVAPGGTSISNSASVGADDSDPFSANNSAAVSTSVFGRK
jgi:hypothetical protein